MIGPFATTTEMLAALGAGDISAVELVELHLNRLATYDGVLNAVPVTTPERARAAAVAADTARARRTPPVAGSADDAEGIDADGRAAPIGRHHRVEGPPTGEYDIHRTPGGSTGGGGAALAAGLTPLEIGSEIGSNIGGSIRVPAAYCGVYGHRPSETAVPRTGLFPFADIPTAGWIMGVQGPMARSAIDLELLFDVIAGPEVGEDVAWRLVLPPSRRGRLADFRVAVMPPFTLVEPSLRARADVASAAMADGMVLDAAELQRLLRRRGVAQAAWRRFFTDWDVLVCPSALDAAFEHETRPATERTLSVDGRSVPYMLNVVYPMWPIFAGLPATALPAGLDNRGLPLGLQAIGPYLEDRTTLRFAQLLERDWRGFEPPPGY